MCFKVPYIDILLAQESGRTEQKTEKYHTMNLVHKANPKHFICRCPSHRVKLRSILHHRGAALVADFFGILNSYPTTCIACQKLLGEAYNGLTGVDIIPRSPDLLTRFSFRVIIRILVPAAIEWVGVLKCLVGL